MTWATNEWRPMYRQNKIETDEGDEDMMVEVGKYETAKGVKSFSSAIEFDDSKDEELYYLSEDGKYYKV